MNHNFLALPYVAEMWAPVNNHNGLTLTRLAIGPDWDTWWWSPATGVIL